jgi:glutamyl-tRNA synthetase
MEVLDWAGIPFDEGPGRDGGHGPYVQSERFHLYGEYAEKLVSEGKAYRCFCSAERLDSLRKTQMKRGLPGMYDRFCLRLNPSQIEERIKSGQTHVIRMKVPPGSTTVEDTVMGQIKVANNVVDDQVLLKSDKFPTYHLANVVDDHTMKITHVIRGEEWLPSTPKHLMLYDMFGWKAPTFIHLPLLLNTDRSKLSKRQSHTSVNWYRDQGYMPEAVINFVALLGWNPGNDDYQEIFTLPELLQKFSIAQVNKSGAIVNLAKLDWLNSQHVRLMAKSNPKLLLERIRPYVDKKLSATETHSSTKSTDFDGDLMIQVITSMEDGRFNTLPELVDRTLLFFIAPDHSSEQSRTYLSSIAKPHSLQVIKAIIKSLETRAESQEPWNAETASDLLKSVLEGLKPLVKGVKKPDVFQVSRYAMAGLADGPEVPIMMGLVGIQKTISRFESALPHVEALQSASQAL